MNDTHAAPVSLVTPEIKTAEDVLRQALTMRMSSVVIVGETADGKLYILSSPMRHQDMNWHLDRAKVAIIPQPSKQLVRP